MFDIQEELKKLPSNPGVYLMHDEQDVIIYVGKAVVLKNRVRQYFQSSRNLTPKIQQMVRHVRRFEYIITDSELEALVLECNLIKLHRPKYNTMLKDDKSYPYIKVTTGEMYPRIMLVRSMKKDKSKYFGPFTSVQSVRDTIELIQKLYQIRNCNRQLPKETGNERPCLYYHMGQCQAPCQGYIDESQYKENIKQALNFLNGNFEPVMKMLTDQMYAASENMEYEKAATYRDLLRSVKQIDQKQKMISQDMDDRDIIAVAREGQEAVAQIFFIRNGKMIGREHFYIQGIENDTNADIISAFIKQYYISAPYVPSVILTQVQPEDSLLIEQWLSERKTHKVKIMTPKKGQKEKLVELAIENARNVLKKDKERIKLEEARTIGAASELADLLGLKAGIFRMEAFDISNISGVETVGSMVVYENGRPKRHAYRKFKINTVKGQNDYKSMEEVLTRRFEHGILERHQKETGESLVKEAGFADFPDVIMMDGGKGQVNIALKVLEQLGLDIPVCGMVKDDHHRTRGLYYQQKELPISKYSEVFKLITRMQDEAHRFAIEYHRSLRSKTQVKSVLDDIKGIGPVRRKSLMQYYGDIEKIRQAEIESLCCVEGMDRRSAEAVYAYFH